jgi:2'-5' RNA ligase
VRIFIGIEIDEAARSTIDASAQALRRRIDRSAADSAVRWVPRENLHITIWFIGHVDDDRARAVLAAIDAPYLTGPFTIELTGMGLFPRSGPPRVLWIGVGAGHETLGSLHGAVQSRLVPLGFEPERRPYSPHLTLARVKDVERKYAATLRTLVQTMSAPPVRSAVTAVTVFESRVSSKGAAYTPLLRVPLRQRP